MLEQTVFEYKRGRLLKSSDWSHHLASTEEVDFQGTKRMLKNIWSFLIFCGVLWQGTLGTVANEENKESSDVVIRAKRVINKELGGDVPAEIVNVPYIVNIKRFNRANCAGSILSPTTVITAAKCVEFAVSTYKVYSGSSSAFAGLRHTVLTKKLRFIRQPYRSWDGIALITVVPHFVYNQHTRNIQLYPGAIRPGIQATVSGWGYNCATRIGTQHPQRLRSISVPIIIHEVCANNYRGQMQIFESEICTFDTQKHCGHTDAGAPLVIENQLIGVHLLSGSLATSAKPDVFAYLQYIDFFHWVRSNI